MSTINVLKKNTESSSKMTLKSQKLLAGALSLVLVAGMISPAFALNIDTFDSPTFELTADDGSEHSPTDDITNTGAGLIAIGESRYVQVTWISGANDIMAQSNSDGVLALSSDFNTDGEFYLKYDNNTNGLGGVDFTANGGDRIIVDFIDADAGSDVTVTVMDTGAGTSSQTLMTSGGPEVLEFEFASFSAGADFTDVDKIEVLVAGVPNGDYAIDLIGVPQRMVGGTVGSMDSVTLLVAGAQANMGLWALALVGAVVSGGAIIYKTKSKKTEQ